MTVSIFFWFSTLRRQMAWGGAIFLAAMLGLLVILSFQREKQHVLRLQADHAQALAQSIALSSAAWLSARDYYGLQEIIDAQRSHHDLTYAMIIDGSNMVVAHTDRQYLGQYLLDTPKTKEPVALTSNSRLIDVFYPVYRNQSFTGWVRIGISLEQAQTQLQRNMYQSLLYVTLALLLIIGLTNRITRRITHRLYAIQQVAGAILKGDQNRRVELAGNDEAANLARQFNAMLDELAHERRELKASENRFRTLVEYSPSPLLIVSPPPESKILLMNQRFSEVFGYSIHDVWDIQSWWPKAYPDPVYRQQVQQQWQQVIDQMQQTGSNRITPLSVIITCGNGEQRIVEVGMASIENMALVVFKDVTELEQHRQHLEELVAERTRQLAGALESAQAANRAKSVFLSNMSHELRTPLNAILGFAQLMERDPRIPADQRINLATINRSGQYLLSLINDVLAISKIEAGRMSVTIEELDLQELLNTTVEIFQPRARQKNLTLSLEIAPQLPRYITSDLGKLRQILLNLLSNAVKFTEHGSIKLVVFTRSFSDKTLLYCEVHDSGPGIAEEEYQRLFLPFYQTEHGIKQGEGTGLGLAICQQFAQLLGGQVEIESQPDSGSLFRVILPVTFTEHLSSASKTSTTPVLKLLPGQPVYKILVAEDKIDNQHLIAELLQQVGFEVQIAVDGAQALTLFQSWHPDLILMDMRMPVMDGYASTSAIRQLENGANIPIIALTASAFEEDRAGILAAGCNDYLRKPIEFDRFFEVLAHYLDVEYQYEQTSTVTKYLDEKPDFSVLPAAMRQRLATAALELDMDAMRIVAAELSAEYPTLAAYITEAIDTFSFEALTELLA